LTHRWGSGINIGGPVVVDQLRASVETSTGLRQLLNLNRTKRKNGRGPKTIVATLTDPSQRVTTLDVEWAELPDIQGTSTNKHIQGVIRLKDKTGSFAVELKPTLGFAKETRPPAIRTLGSFVVSGTHTGYGFADLYPLEGALEKDGLEKSQNAQ